MRALQIAKFYPPVRGGIETVAYELTEGMNRFGLRTDVLCANVGQQTLHERAPAGYDIVRAGCLGQWLSTSVSPALIQQTRRLAGRYDVLHVHMPNPMAALAVWAAKPRVPIVVHWHSDVVRQRAARCLYRPLQSWLIDRAQAVIATTQAYAEASHCLRRCVSKVEVIPIGISDLRSRVRADQVAAIRARYPGKRIVLALGRMTYYKGFDVLIRAARQLPHDTQVLIVGAGQLYEACQRQIREQEVGDKVQMLGLLPPNDLLHHHAAADAFCLPSTARSEAFGVAMLEAMAMGKPVVSSRIEGSGVTWVNLDGVTGLTVPVGDCAALAQALRRVLDNPELASKLGAAGRRRFVEHFTADAAAQRVARLYRELGHRRHQGAA